MCNGKAPSTELFLTPSREKRWNISVTEIRLQMTFFCSPLPLFLNSQCCSIHANPFGGHLCLQVFPSFLLSSPWRWLYLRPLTPQVMLIGTVVFRPPAIRREVLMMHRKIFLSSFLIRLTVCPVKEKRPSGDWTELNSRIWRARGRIFSCFAVF